MNGKSDVKSQSIKLKRMVEDIAIRRIDDIIVI